MQQVVVHKKKRIKKNQKEQLKNTKYGYLLFQNVDQIKVFYVVGDIDIDVDQLLNKDFFNICVSINQFNKVTSMIKQPDLDFVDIFFDTNMQRQGDLSVPIRLLRDSHQSDLNSLADIIEYYNQIIQKKMKQQSQSIQQIQSIQHQLPISEPLSELDCDEYHGWNFEKSLEKAWKAVYDFKMEMKDSKNHCCYAIFKGYEYDQVKYCFGQKLDYYRHFYCLNEEQIDFLNMRKPLIFNYKYLHQYIQFVAARFKRLIMIFNQEKSERNHFRKGLKFLFEQEIDAVSVDNLTVRLKFQEYLYILSNYKNQQDDVMLVQKILPIGDKSATDILKAQRNLKSQLSEEEYNSMKNPFYGGQIYRDVIYEAQSEIFKDKFYSIVENNVYQSLQEQL
ncbi:hypothetical protein ABPG74_019684 [Tetrahymena malaccensis]